MNFWKSADLLFWKSAGLLLESDVLFSISWEDSGSIFTLIYSSRQRLSTFNKKTWREREREKAKKESRNKWKSVIIYWRKIKKKHCILRKSAEDRSGQDTHRQSISGEGRFGTGRSGDERSGDQEEDDMSDLVVVRRSSSDYGRRDGWRKLEEIPSPLKIQQTDPFRRSCCGACRSLPSVNRSERRDSKWR